MALDAHGESAILVKNNIQHFESTHYATHEIQATNIFLKYCIGLISNFRHIRSIKKEDYDYDYDQNSV